MALVPHDPVLAERIRGLGRAPLISHYLGTRQHLSRANASKWADVTVKALTNHDPIPTSARFAMELPEQHGAPVAIWLGILLDGIPEGLVIGASLVSSHLSVSLIAGLFIANYPEALSSSAGMREQGFSWWRIHVMWGSLVLATGLLAAVGNLFFVGASPEVFTFIQGLAAGAMLTMISQTMLPEAYFRGGSIIGMATLLGFLAAILLKAV
jgi:zinc transporter ZupT